MFEYKEVYSNLRLFPYQYLSSQLHCLQSITGNSSFPFSSFLLLHLTSFSFSFFSFAFFFFLLPSPSYFFLSFPSPLLFFLLLLSPFFSFHSSPSSPSSHFFSFLILSPPSSPFFSLFSLPYSFSFHLVPFASFSFNLFPSSYSPFSSLLPLHLPFFSSPSFSSLFHFFLISPSFSFLQTKLEPETFPFSSCNLCLYQKLTFVLSLNFWTKTTSYNSVP